jgi:cation transport ATPase
VSALLFAVMITISLVLVGRELEARSPRTAVRRARARLRLAPERRKAMSPTVP